MKAVIPAAGRGTRLYPQTHTKPKPMVRLAGKPILGHILDGVLESPIDEVVIVVGVMRDHVINYVRDAYGAELDIEFAVQEETDGLGHCVYQTRDYFSGESMCLLLGDMLFESGVDEFIEKHQPFETADGSIGVKPVDEPSNYGIVNLDGEFVSSLVEKPDNPDSNLAISGVYMIEATEMLFAELEYLIDNGIRGVGDEYQLTDALQRMVEQGATFGTFSVDEWYDCGRPETLLEANRVLLETHETETIDTNQSVIIPPVAIGDDVSITNSIVGPYVSVDAGAEIEDSRVRESIIGTDADLADANIAETIIGNNASITCTPSKLNVGDYSDIQL